MDDTSKYLIHADITADGVVERSDVVGAIFGQTEGLLGDDLDLRDLQQASKIGRIDVEVDSENGQSYGEITIASSLDKVETAILAASLETISRVGPCRASVAVADIEDVREAKRREVVERAKELLAGSFDESIMTSGEILEEVRESARVENITEYAGLPAGPRVTDSDAIIVVEGRADVLCLLRYGVKNAIAVEGTNVPEEVAALTRERTVTAFLDGDRGGELILRELAQVGEIDYVTFAPEGRSVEDLARHEVMSALRGKTPYDRLVEDGDFQGEVAADGTGEVATAGLGELPSEPADRDGEGDAGDAADPAPDASEPGGDAVAEGTSAAGAEASDGHGARAGDAHDGEAAGDGETGGDGGASETEAEDRPAETEPWTLRGHVRSVVEGESGTVRLLDDDLTPVAEAPAEDAFDLLRDADQPPHAVVLDGEVTQRILDVAAQRGVEHLLGRSTGEFVKRPVGVRVRTADQLASG